MMHRYEGWHDGPGVMGWVLMALLMVAFWGGLAWVIVSFVRHGGSGPHPVAGPTHTIATPAQTKGPEDILHDRLARGDINVDEYHARIDALRAKKPD